MQEFARKTSYGAGAHPIGAVTCAGGFAVLRIKADSTPDGVSTIYALGPPLRYLAMGTGPICSDNPADGDVTVPHSAASKLNCISSASSADASPAGGADLASYAGEWEAHGVHVTFNSTGRGQVGFRTYNWCDGTGNVIPADPTVPCETPPTDLDVGKATVQLESTPTGLSLRTLASNDHKSWPIGQRQAARLARPGVLELSRATGTWALCKPPASDDGCGL